MIARQSVKDPLKEITQSLREAIARYKWVESERTGRDIGWENAASEWTEKHFSDWKRSHWERAIAEATNR